MIHLKFIQEADLNGDGTIDKEEFINVFDTLFGLQGKVNVKLIGRGHLARYVRDQLAHWLLITLVIYTCCMNFSQILYSVPVARMYATESVLF